MKVEWLLSGFLQLEPETAQDVFKLVDFVKSLENDDAKEAPSHLSETLPERSLPVQAQAEQPCPAGTAGIWRAAYRQPENPIIENRSGQTVIAYVFVTATRNGYTSLDQPLLAASMQPAGIPDGGSLYARGAMPVNPPGPIERLAFQPLLSGFYSAPLSSAGGRGFSPGPIVRATLRSVIFGDGQFVSPDEHGAFELFSSRMQAVREVGMMAKAGEWEQIEALATARTNTSLLLRRLAEKDAAQYVERVSAAPRLVLERKQKGDAAAAQLAELYSSLPALWK